MTTLKIDEKKALRLYPSASPEFKAMLEDSFGVKFFKKDIKDRIKSFEDACSELSLDPNNCIPNVENCVPEDQGPTIAFLKLSIIARALNEGWKANWNDSSEYKYFPWFKYDRSASGFVYSYADCTYTYTYFGARLCFKSSELAEYAGEQFTQLYNIYFGK